VEIKFAYQVNVVSLEFLQTRFNGEMHALRTGPSEVALLYWLLEHIWLGILCRNDHLLPTASLLQPFSNPLFALAALIGVGGIDEVAAEVVKCV
jgi:hypothetical protein